MVKQRDVPPAATEPDLLYIAEAHRDRIKDAYPDGPADLVVGIVSPESAGRDRGDKFYEYQAAGIPEYWLIDAEREAAEFYQLDERGRYQLVPADANGVYHSRALAGLWLRVTWLWQQPLPDPVDALLEIDGDAYARYLRERLRHAGR